MANISTESVSLSGNVIQITEPGIYDVIGTVTVQGDLSNASVWALVLNGNVIPGTTFGITGAFSTSDVTLTGVGLIEVSTVPATLTLRNVSNDTETLPGTIGGIVIDNAAIRIIKIADV